MKRISATLIAAILATGLCFAQDRSSYDIIAWDMDIHLGVQGNAITSRHEDRGTGAVAYITRRTPGNNRPLIVETIYGKDEKGCFYGFLSPQDGEQRLEFIPFACFIFDRLDQMMFEMRSRIEAVPLESEGKTNKT